MPKKKKAAKVRITITVDPELLKQAKERGLIVSQVAEAGIREALYERTDENTPF